MPVINDSLFWVLVLVIPISVLVMVLEIYRVVLGDHALLRRARRTVRAPGARSGAAGVRWVPLDTPNAVAIADTDS
jgi:hypothetical protein